MEWNAPTKQPKANQWLTLKLQNVTTQEFVEIDANYECYYDNGQKWRYRAGDEEQHGSFKAESNFIVGDYELIGWAYKTVE